MDHGFRIILCALIKRLDFIVTVDTECATFSQKSRGFMPSKQSEHLFTIPADQVSSRRLDQVCFEMLPHYSRSFAQKLILKSCVTLNGIAIDKPSYKVRPGDAIALQIPPEKALDLTPIAVDFEVIYESDDFLIINKPAGVSVHPAPTDDQSPTIVHGLLARYPEFTSFEDSERPGIVHRIDKDTSGILIVARNVPAAITFSRMFKDREIHKTYLAVVKGHPARTGSIKYSIGRHPTLRHKMSHLSPQGRDALTHYKVVDFFEENSLLEVNIVTGRTHQIRVHCAAIGHGLLGDSTYGVNSPLIARQALHAAQCSFTYKGTTYAFEAPLPADMTGLLEKLKI